MNTQHTQRAKKGILSVSVSLMLGSSLLYGCSPYPASVSQPTTNQFNSNDPYLSQAQIALASYQEVDASFADSQVLASQRFSTMQVDGTVGTTTGVSTTLDGTTIGTTTTTDVNASSGTGAAAAGAAAGASTSTDSSVRTDANGDGVVDDNDLDVNLGSGLSNTPGISTNINPVSLSNGLGANLNSGLGLDLTNGATNATAVAQTATQISSQIDGVMNTQFSSLNNYTASVDLFNRVTSSFSNQILAADGVELDSQGRMNINVNRLMANIRADLRGDAELMNTSLDLNGQLNAGTNSNISLNHLNALGFSGTSSNVLKQSNADGTSSEYVLLSFQNKDAQVNNRVLVTSKLRGQVTDELNLRLDSLAKGFTRTGLREISRDSNGNTQLTTEVTMKLHNGSTIDLSEKRFVTANGAGTGFGTFNIVTSSGQNFSGSMRTVASADGKLMLLFEPTDSNYGRLVLQESTNAQANLAVYNAQGNLTGTTQMDLEAALDAMTETKA